MISISNKGTVIEIKWQIKKLTFVKKVQANIIKIADLPNRSSYTYRSLIRIITYGAACIFLYINDTCY